MSVRGLANIILHPESFSPHYFLSNNRVSRGVKLDFIQANNDIQQSVVNALAESINATCLSLDRDIFDTLRKEAIELGVPRKELTRSKLLSSFFESLKSSTLPSIIYLPDNAQFLLSSQNCCDIFLQKVKEKNTNYFFVLSALSDEIDPSEAVRSFPNPTEPEEIDPNGFQNFGMNSFPFPTVGPQNYQYMLKNGTMPMQNGFPAQIITGFPLPNPPEAMMKRIISEHQKKMHSKAKSPNPSFNDQVSIESFNEAMQDLLSDPECGNEIKEFLDKILQTISQSVPPEKFKEMQAAMKEGKMNMRIDMMQVPMGFQFPPPFPPSPSSSTSPPFPPFPPFPPHPGMMSFNRPGPRPTNNQKINENNLPQKQGNENDKNSKDSKYKQKKLSPSGNAFLQYLESYTISTPTDINLKSRWIKMHQERSKKNIFNANKKILMQEFKKFDTICKEDIFLLLEDTLSSGLISREEAKSISLKSIKLQAGMYKYEHEEKNTHSKFLSSWALEIACNDVFKHSSRSHVKLFSETNLIAPRSKEEVLNLVTDKQERSLISNIIFPQEIGISYDMIGGLDVVKEILRQCVTYPLKYPRLYREGIAAEAVKGVLLFGPPGLPFKLFYFFFIYKTK